MQAGTWTRRISVGFAVGALVTVAVKCPNCFYPLRGLPEGTPCPECGAARAGAHA